MDHAARRFQQRYQPVYDAIASADLDQEDREALARDMAERIARGVVPGREARPDPDFRHDLFVLLASDPLVPCAGYDIPEQGGRHVDCPKAVKVRLAMHLRDAPDGRSAAWRRRAPYGEIRCISCGSMHGNAEYRAAALDGRCHHVTFQFKRVEGRAPSRDSVDECVLETHPAATPHQTYDGRTWSDEP